MEGLGLNEGAYAGRKVLVTGHTGFKGSWLVVWLTRLGARVAGIGLAPDTEPSLFETARVAPLMNSHLADIRDPDATTSTVASEQPEIIFHLAAQPLVRHGLRDPLATFATNVMGTAHVLEAARRCATVRAVIVVTSDKCYENHPSPRGYRESDRLGGHDPYSASKACTEIVAQAWRSSYWSTPDAPLLATARAGNVIGGGDWAEDRLVPDLVRAARAGRPAPIRNPGAVRPWQHVLEPLGGYLLLGAYLLAGGRRFASAWNFGPALEDMQPVSALCDALAPTLGVRWETDTGDHPTEATILRLDNTRACLELGWRPRWALGRAIEQTGEWYARHAAGADARTLMLEQIEAYSATAEETVR